MSNVLVTGGNRGIGLEICRQLSSRGDMVTTTCRNTSKELEDLGVRVIENIDVSEPDAANLIKSKLNDEPIDTLIHNAGILSNESLSDMNFERIEEQFKVNTLGPLRIIYGLLQNLSAGSKIGILSSRMGSMEDNGSGGMYGYRISKAGANAVGVSLARDLKEKQISVAILHPGLVATDMTGKKGIPPQDSARGLIDRMDKLKLTDTGKFWHAEGYILPW